MLENVFPALAFFALMPGGVGSRFSRIRTMLQGAFRIVEPYLKIIILIRSCGHILSIFLALRLFPPSCFGRACDTLVAVQVHLNRVTEILDPIFMLLFRMSEALLTAPDQIRQSSPISALIAVVVGKQARPGLLIEPRHTRHIPFRIYDRDMPSLARRHSRDSREDQPQINCRIPNPIEQSRDDAIFITDDAEERVDLLLGDGDLVQTGAEDAFGHLGSILGFQLERPYQRLQGLWEGGFRLEEEALPCISVPSLQVIFGNDVVAVLQALAELGQEDLELLRRHGGVDAGVLSRGFLQDAIFVQRLIPDGDEVR